MRTAPCSYKTSPRHALTGITSLLLAMLWSSAPAMAQSGDDADSSIDVDIAQDSIRAQLTLDGIPTRGEPPILVLHRSADNQGWRVTVMQKEGKRLQELTTLTLVEWAGEAYYDYKVTLQPSELDRHWYVLFEVIPNEEMNAPLSAPTLQLVWQVEAPRRGTTRWKYITKAQYSDLDGGDKLWLSEKDSKHYYLNRRRPEMGMRFCGLAPDEVFESEKFAPDKGIFVMEVDADRLAEGATSLQAFLPTVPFEPEDIYGYALWRAATSDLRTPTDITTVLRPLELGDRVNDSIWAEGAPGDGRGEFVTARVEASLPLKGFRIYPGNGGSERDYNAWPRPKRLLVGVSNGERFVVDLPDSSYATVDGKNGLLVELSSPIKTSCMSVLLLEAHPAKGPAPKRKKFKRERDYEAAVAARTAVAIAEITPISILQDLPPSSAAQEILKIIYNEEDAGRRRKLGLMTRSYSNYIIEALRQRLDKPDGLENLDHAASLLAALPSEESVPLLIGLIDRVEPETGSWRSLRRALATHHEAAAEPLLEVLRTLPKDQERKRIDLIRLYGRVATPEQLEALLGQLGEGGALERNERVRAVASGNEAMIPILLGYALENLEQPAGEDALKALDTIGRRLLQRPELSDEDRDALIALGMQVKSRRATVRVIHLLAHYQPEGSERLLSERILLQRRDPIVRREAATALGTFGGETSLRALEEALLDISPDVRIAAIRALMQRDDGKQASSSVLNYVGRERWTDGLKPALMFLTSLKDDAIDARLEEMILDADKPTRGYLTAQAFERSRRGISHEVAATLLFEDRTTFDMRRQLIELLAYDDSPEGEAMLVRVVKRNPFVKQEEPRRVEALTSAGILALGKRRSEPGKEVLLDVARDGANIRLQHAALRGLSFYADPALVEELGKMRATAPVGMREAIDEARSTIDNRVDLERATEAIKDFEEKERERQIEREAEKDKPTKSP